MTSYKTHKTDIANAQEMSAGEGLGTTSAEALCCNLAHIDRIANSLSTHSINRVGNKQLTVSGLAHVAAKQDKVNKSLEESLLNKVDESKLVEVINSLQSQINILTTAINNKTNTT